MLFPGRRRRRRHAGAKRAPVVRRLDGMWRDLTRLAERSQKRGNPLRERASGVAAQLPAGNDDAASLLSVSAWPDIYTRGRHQVVSVRGGIADA